LKLSPKHRDASFEKLAAMRVAKIGVEDFKREVARMRATFHDFSDVVQQINKLEVDCVAQQGDLDAARKLVRQDATRMSNKDRERTDLILDSVFREAELAEATGDAEKIGRIYRGAMRDKGNEVVAFRKIAKHYYAWGKKSNLGQPTVRDTVATFDQKHKEPSGDVFAMGAYRAALGDLIKMVKEQGMTTQENTLERREAQLKALEENFARSRARTRRGKAGAASGALASSVIGFESCDL